MKPPPPPAYLAHLRDARVRAETMLDRARRIQAALKLKDPSARLAELRAVVAKEKGHQHDDVWNVGDRLRKAREALEQLPGSLEDSGDRLSKIEVQWRLALSHWPNLDAEVQEQDVETYRAELPAAVRELRELVVSIGRATIPYRLERWLRDVRVGGQLDFHAAFIDELPRFADRKAVMELMARAQATSGGLVEPTTGRVFRISESRWRQVLSYVLIGIVALLGAGLIWVLAVLGPTWDVPGWPYPRERLSALLSGYAFVLAGALLHIVIDALKQSRQARGTMQLVALDELWLWGHVRERSILVAVVALVAVTLGLAAIPGVELSFLTALFAGYSADSIIDLFLKRFETFSQAHVTALQKTLESKAE